jgi:hypothetical protein
MLVKPRISAARAERLKEERTAQQAWLLKQSVFAPAIENLLHREFLEQQAASDLEAR